MRLTRLVSPVSLFLLALTFSLSGFFSSVPSVEAVCTWSTTAYVDASAGTDYGPSVCTGTTSGTAYKTVSAALASRNWKYSGKSITIYYKGNTNQTLNNAGSSNDVLLTPYGGSSTSAVFTISGDEKITVTGFTFTGSGGVSLTGTSDYVLIDKNTFSTSTSNVSVTGTNTVTISNNTFKSAFVYAHGNSGLVALDMNNFSGAASKTWDGKKWFVVADQVTGGFYFLGSHVTVESGNVLYVQDSPGFNIMDNEVTGAGVGTKAFQLKRSNGAYITGNEVSNVSVALSASGDRTNTISSISQNQFTLVDDATSQASGMEVAYYIVTKVSGNLISGGDFGMWFSPASVTTIESNIVTSSVADIKATNSSTVTIQKNIFSGTGTNIHIVNGSFSEIANNAVWSSIYGIILENSDGRFRSYLETQPVDEAGSSVSTQGSIHDNDFYKSDVAIGMASYDVDSIHTNKFREVDDGTMAYFSDVSKFRMNTLSHDVALVASNHGLYLYGSTWLDVKRNEFTNFEKALTLEFNANISDSLDSNRITGGKDAVSIADAQLTGDIVNNVFATGRYGFTTSGTLSALQLTHNTFYGQATLPLSLLGVFTGPVVIENNIFSGYTIANGVLKVDAFGTLGAYDYNVYNNVGGLLLNVFGTPYYLVDLQALGFEFAAYEEATPSLVNPGAGDYHLSAGSLGVNSANTIYSTPRDIEMKMRPVCALPDRGAYEVSGAGLFSNADTDGDGLCNFQETAWGVLTNNSDTDSDSLSDYLEIYVYETDALSSDSDGDTYNDGDEISDGTDPLDASSHINDGDHDGMDDTWETDNGLDPADAADGALDADSDGLSNEDEFNAETDPNDVDSDDDALEDGDEVSRGTDPLDSDSDGDGFDDAMEVEYGSNPLDGSETPEDLDSDSDGLSDYEEVTVYSTNPNEADSDSDGLDDGDELLTYGSDPLNSDTDGDTLSDGDEVSLYSGDPTLSDTDSDGLDDADEAARGTSLTFSDTDGDSFSDYQEVLVGTDPLDASSTPDTTDTDGDGLYDVLETTYGTSSTDTDSDDDGLTDGEEVNTYTTNPLASDSDSDGLTDSQEVDTYGTDPNDTDSDGDGITDGVEVYSTETDPSSMDSDSDGLNDYEEYYTYSSDPNLSDTDSDGLDDYEEVMTYGTDPNNADSDSDGLSDGEEVSSYGTDPNDSDSDSDGLLDGAEVTAGTDPADSDSDSDGLEDGDEASYSGDPLNADTDGDGLDDGDEVSGGTQVNNSDSDSDGLTDGDEVSIYSSDPLVSDSDGDGLDDGVEVDTYLTDPADADTDGDTYDDGDEVAALTDPLDPADYPSDTDGDGMPNSWETLYSCTNSLLADASDDDDGDSLSHLEEFGLNSDPCDSDTDGDGMDDEWEAVTYSCSDILVADASDDDDTDGAIHSEEYTAGTDPCDSDTDGDLFTDGYELDEGTSPTSASAMPSLELSFVGYDQLFGYGQAGSWTSGLVPYTATISATVDYGENYWIGMNYTATYSATGISFDETQFLGSVEVTDCGRSSSAFDPTSSTSCSSIPLYSATTYPLSVTTEADDSSQLEVWASLSPYYTFADWTWIRSPIAYTSQYATFKVVLVP